MPFGDLTLDEVKGYTYLAKFNLDKEILMKIADFTGHRIFDIQAILQPHERKGKALDG
jgi:hypothetical protein